MDLGFGEALLIFGGLLATAAALSGVMRGTVLSTSVLAVGMGIGLAEAGAVSIEPGDDAIVELITLALVLTLFTDGMFVERELIGRHWSAVARALVIAMPITMALLALAAKLLFPQLVWAEAALLGALLAPTDPVVTSTVVTSRKVSERVRHTLNLESGLNDGLAVPFVLFFLVFASPTGNAADEGLRVLGEAAFGAVIGIVLGFIGGRLHNRLPGGGITPRYEGIYSVGFGLAAAGIADVTFGNILIAAFVCGIAFGAAENEIPDAFVEFAENVSTISQVLTFFVFGALIVATGYHDDIWRLALFIPFALLIGRPLAVMISFIRERLPRSEKLFIAWFGPKGVASMLFALFVLDSDVTERGTIFDVAALTILASIIAHGLTDTIGTRWLGRRAEGPVGAAEP
jgi:sodium/hydrogen antiporter